VVLILAWAFQITSHGIVLDEGDAGDRESGTERHLDTAVNLLLLLSAVALSVLLLVQFLGSPDPSSAADAAPARRPEGVVIASLTLTPTTDVPGNRALAAGVVGELSHRLITLDGIELLATELAVDPADARPHLSLTGTVLLESDSAYVLAQLIDVDSGRYLDSVKLTLPVDSLHRAESQAAEGIVTALRGALLPGSPAAASGMTPRPAAGVARARHDRPASIDSPQR
jgi:TolB-like protein